MIRSSASAGHIVSSSSWDDQSFLMDYASNDANSSSNYYNAFCGIECDDGSLGVPNIYSHNMGWAGSSRTSQLSSETPKQGSQQSFHPEFAKVYHFIGTLIDPDINCTMGMHLQKLKEMDPITAKTVVILVKNLIINLSAPAFDPLISWLTTYDPETKTIGSAMETSALTNVMYPPYQVPHDARYLPQP